MVLYSKKAKKNLNGSSKKQQTAIDSALTRFNETGVGDVKPLKGELSGLHRLSVGQFRVLMVLEGGDIHVNSVAARQGAY